MKNNCKGCSSDKNGWCTVLETNSPNIKMEECWSIVTAPTRQDLIDQIKHIESGLDKLKDMVGRFKENRD